MKKIILFLSLAVVVPWICFAQSNRTDSVTITTYYPAPYGVYRNLKLNPTTEPTGAALSRGVMYYDDAQNVLKYRNNLTWVNVTGGSGFSFAQCRVENHATLPGGRLPTPVHTFTCSSGYAISGWCEIGNYFSPSGLPAEEDMHCKGNSASCWVGLYAATPCGSSCYNYTCHILCCP